MTPVLRALGRAAHDALQPRMLAVMLLPGVGALVAWSIAATVYWTTWTGWIRDALSHSALVRWSDAWGGWLLSSASFLLVAMVLIPAIIVTALLINEVVVMPLVMRLVSQRHFPALERRGFGGISGGIMNALASGALFGVLWLLTVPLWFTGIGAILVPALNSAYLNVRVFRYDALAEHATAAEYAVIRQRARGRLFALGLALAPLYYVPVVNLVAPVIAALAFTHLCLDELRRVRALDQVT